MKRRLALASLGWWLGGCTSPSRQHSAPFWSGRLGLQIHSEPPQNLQASFELQGGPEQGDFTLLNPLGGVLARLAWHPQQATLERGAQRLTALSVQELTEQLVQTSLPVQVLFDWMEGRPTAYAGWEVDLSAWAQKRITARRHWPAPTAVLRIVLDQ